MNFVLPTLFSNSPQPVHTASFWNITIQWNSHDELTEKFLEDFVTFQKWNFTCFDPTLIISLEAKLMNEMLPNCSNSSVFALKKNYINLKVSKSQNKLIKSLFLPKYEQNILRISALASKKWLNQKLDYINYVK